MGFSTIKSQFSRNVLTTNNNKQIEKNRAHMKIIQGKIMTQNTKFIMIIKLFYNISFPYEEIINLSRYRSSAKGKEQIKNWKGIILDESIPQDWWCVKPMPFSHQTTCFFFPPTRSKPSSTLKLIYTRISNLTAISNWLLP